MKYTDYLSLTPKDQILYRISTYFQNLKTNFLTFWYRLWIGIVNFFKRLGNSFKNIGYAFKEGDIFTKLSFVFIGLSHIKRKQYIKGIILLAIEALFIYYMIMFGASSLVGLSTLGEREYMYGCTKGGTYNGINVSDIRVPNQASASYICREATGSSDVRVYAGDRSFLFLLLGIIAVIVIILFVCYYVSMIRDSIKVQQKEEARLHNNSFFEDIKEYLDGKFHRTMLLVPVLGICVFTLLPIFDMILMAFTNYDTYHQEPKMFDWVGLDNFASLFTQTGAGSFGYTFWNILLWTLIWAFFATFTNYFLGMIVAMLINRKGIKFKGLWRTLLVLSIAVPSFVSLMAINKFLSAGGIVEGILFKLGVLTTGQTIEIFSYTNSARVAIILINVWIGIPYTVLTVSGILMNIPEDLYESAQIDGTSAFRTYYKITLPYVVFITGPSLISTFVGNINNFNVIFFLSGGGPTTLEYMNAGKTDLLVTWLYKLTVNQSNYSLGSVIGILVFVVCAVASLIAFRHTSGYKNEETFA